MKSVWRRLALAALLALTLPSTADDYPASLDQRELIIETTGGHRHTITARAAVEPAARRRGMQNLAAATVRDNPLWFVFPRERRTSWHMHNVAIALVIAYVDNNGRVVGVERMEPGRTGYGIDRPIRYALEVAAERAEDLGLEAGARIRAADGTTPP